MNFNFYLEKLHSSEDYQKFTNENPDAYLCSGFFIIDLEGKEKSESKNNLDYYIPSSKKMFGFQLDNEIQLTPIELYNEIIPEKILIDDFDFENIKELISKEMEKNKIKNKIQKILLSLQSKDNKNFLIGTVFISGLGIIKVNIDLEESKIILFEKKSFFDFVRKG